MSRRALLPPYRINLVGDTANCLHASQGGKFYKVVDAGPRSLTDPVEMEIANAVMISRVIDPHSARTPRYVGASRACVAKRAGSLGYALAPCTTIRGPLRHVAVVYAELSVRAAGDHVYAVAHNNAASLRDSAMRRASVLIAQFCDWFMGVSSRYDLRHNDMHSANVVYDRRERTLKLIDWGRTGIGRHASADVDAAMAQIRAVMGPYNAFEYSRELRDLEAKWPHVRANLRPRSRDPRWDEPWAADVTMFLAWIAHDLSGVWKSYPEVGIRYARATRTFVLSEVVDEVDMNARIASTFASPASNGLYLMCLCGAQAIAFMLQTGRSARKNFETLVADLTDTKYTSVVGNIRRAVDLRKSAARVGGGDGAGDALDGVMSFLFPTSLSQAMRLRDERSLPAAPSATAPEPELSSDDSERDAPLIVGWRTGIAPASGDEEDGSQPDGEDSRSFSRAGSRVIGTVIAASHEPDAPSYDQDAGVAERRGASRHAGETEDGETEDDDVGEDGDENEHEYDSRRPVSGGANAPRGAVVLAASTALTLVLSVLGSRARS